MSDRDLLIGRIVDREDSPTDWASVEGLAADDCRARDDLFAALRDESLLRTAVGEVVAVADRVDIGTGGLPRRHTMIHWGGWMAAAVLALIWIATDGRKTRVPESRVPARVASDRFAGDRFVRELPNVMVETRQVPGSDKTEVLYVRRVLERKVVSGAYTMAMDETGQPVRVQADLTRFTPKRSY